MMTDLDLEEETIDFWYDAIKNFVLTECTSRGIDLDNDENHRQFLASAFGKCEEFMWNYLFINPHEDE